MKIRRSLLLLLLIAMTLSPSTTGFGQTNNFDIKPPVAKKIPKQVTLDLNEMAKGLKFLSLGAYSVSDDGNLLAYSTDTTGYRQYTLHFKDLRTGQVLPDQAERVRGVAWASDNKTVMFVTEDAVT